MDDEQIKRFVEGSLPRLVDIDPSEATTVDFQGGWIHYLPDGSVERGEYWMNPLGDIESVTHRHA